jgi:hypothetical protein
MVGSLYKMRNTYSQMLKFCCFMQENCFGRYAEDAGAYPKFRIQPAPCGRKDMCDIQKPVLTGHQFEVADCQGSM